MERSSTPRLPIPSVGAMLRWCLRPTHRLPTEEDGDGTIPWIGRSCSELYLLCPQRGGQGDPARGGGNQRSGSGGLPEAATGQTARLCGRGRVEPVAARDSLATCRGDDLGLAGGQTGGQERRSRCSWLGRAAADRTLGAGSLQSTAEVRRIARVGAGLHAADTGCGPAEEPAEKSVSAARDRLSRRGDFPGRGEAESAQRVAEGDAADGGAAGHGAGPSRGAQGRGCKGDAGTVAPLPDRSHPGDCTGHGTDSSGPTAADRRDPAPIPYQAAVLVLLRLRCGDSFLGRLGAPGWRLGQGPRGDDAGAEPQSQPYAENDFQGGGHDGDRPCATESSARGLRPALRTGNEAELGQADGGTPHRRHGVGHVETPGGVRPEARLSRAPARQRRRRRESRTTRGRRVQPPRRNGSRVSIHLTNGPAAVPAGPIAWLCPLGEPNEDVALKALMDGWFLPRERTTKSASRFEATTESEAAPPPYASAKRGGDRTGTFDVSHIERSEEVWT